MSIRACLNSGSQVHFLSLLGQNHLILYEFTLKWTFSANRLIDFMLKQLRTDLASMMLCPKMRIAGKILKLSVLYKHTAPLERKSGLDLPIQTKQIGSSPSRELNSWVSLGSLSPLLFTRLIPRYFLHNYFQHLLIREYDHE